MPPRPAALPSASAAALPPCRLLALPRELLQEKILANLTEQRDLAALACTCGALYRAIVFPRARVVLLSADEGAAPLRKRRAQWALSALARAQVVEICGCSIKQLSDLLLTLGGAANGGVPVCRSLREIRLPEASANGLADDDHDADQIDSLQSILPSGCIVVLKSLINPLPTWLQSAGGVPSFTAPSYVFHLSSQFSMRGKCHCWSSARTASRRTRPRAQRRRWCSLVPQSAFSRPSRLRPCLTVTTHGSRPPTRRHTRQP